jgi:DNA-binding CsgD family transcriptional regulator
MINKIRRKPMITTSEVVALWNELGDVRKIAERTGIKPCSVQYHLRRGKIDFVKRINNDEIKLLASQGLSFSQIARNMSIDLSVVSVHCKSMGIKSSHLHLCAVKDIPIDIIIEQYKSGRSLSDLSEEYSVSVPLLIRKLKKRNIKIRSGPEQSRKYSIEEIILAHDRDGLDRWEIAERFGMHPNHVYRVLRSNGYNFSRKKPPVKLADVDWLQDHYMSKA